MSTISQLLSFVPDDLLERLAISTNVNKFSKKLQGELMFKLLLYSIISEKENSLRGMQSAKITCKLILGRYILYI